MTSRMSELVTRARLFVVLTRPAVLVLLALFAVTGLAQAGHAGDRWALARVLAVVVGFLVFSVAWNDIADEAIDRVNLPGHRRRPLASGLTDRRDMAAVGCAGGALALAAGVTLGWEVVVVVAGGLVVSASYSLRPVRIADRGAAASLLLPAAYVAVPYLTGVLAVGSRLSADGVLLLVALYTGFIGRILLKDFRDVRGDALFGKRTFLVRHGRRRTCATSAVLWTVGTAGMAAAGPHPALVLAIDAVSLTASLVLLRALAGGGRGGVLGRGGRGRDVLGGRGWPRRDEAIIAGLAIVGRSTVTVLVLALSTGHWPAVGREVALIAFAAVAGWQAVRMVSRGPTTTWRLPAAFSTGMGGTAGDGRMVQQFLVLPAQGPPTG